MGAEARSIGHGGIRLVARAAGAAEVTVSEGVRELEDGGEPLGRARRPGGGRKRLADVDPGLRPALLALVEPDERGDPMSPLRWTTKSTRNLAGELTGQGHRISADTVGDLLRDLGFSLQGNAKTLEGKQDPDRDAQFRYISEQAKEHQDAGNPVVSVDTKKKEQVGQYKNNGLEWRPEGEPIQVSDHDFPDEELGKAVPYGIYDIAANTGWVNVGTDHDTAAFAVESIRRWWHAAGHAAYPAARRLLITADAGGSNGYRTRAWKSELAAFAAETGLAVTVCHFPPGTSKWNRIEHRLFSAITSNWRGRPLTSHEVIVSVHRSDHHPHRPDRPRRARHRPVPGRGRCQRRGARRAADHPAPLPRRLELHHGAKAREGHGSRPPAGRSGADSVEPGPARTAGRPRADRHVPAAAGRDDRRAGPVPGASSASSSASRGAVPNVAAPGRGAPASSSPPPTGSWRPSCTCASPARRHCWPSSSRSTGKRSPSRFRRPAPSWTSTDTSSLPRQPGSTFRRTCSPTSPKPTPHRAGD